MGVRGSACLQAALALDPDNAAARADLAKVQCKLKEAK